MKNSLLIIAFLLVLFVGNAQDKGQNISTKTATNTTKAKSDNPTSNNLADNDLNKKLRDLEIKIKDLQAQIDGQNSKTRFAFMQISSNPIFNTAFEDFLFASDDLWNSTVDVGLAECSKACQKESSKRQKTCDKLRDGQEKIDCYNDSSSRARKCQKNCQKQFVNIK